MLIESVSAVLRDAERNDKIATRFDLVKYLRQVGLDDMGLVLINMPDEKYPKISRLLPSMASQQVQKNWTGDHGAPLLMKTNTFVRFLATSYITLTHKSLETAQILDFGCGYGRVMRSMYYYVDPDNVTGVDPWDRSIEECVNHGIKSNVFLSDYLPKDLPLGNKKFELIYAFSVFTHLSQLATKAALETLRNYIAPGGVLVITIRPNEYWAYDPNIAIEKKAELEAAHKKSGFAFFPHERGTVNGDITYGDTSMTTEWLRIHFPKWSVAQIDRSLIDPYQIYVALTPK
jgi:SAM-dependent methyltransferase